MASKASNFPLSLWRGEMNDNLHDPDSQDKLPAATDTVIAGGSSISLQQLQQIYNEPTGKDESLSKYFRTPVRVEFDDIEQTRHRIAQTCDQYNITSQSAVLRA